MQFIKELLENTTVQEIYYVADLHKKLTKAGKVFLQVTLQDMTGQLIGMIWEPDTQVLVPFEKKDFVTVDGTVSKYNDTLQLSIRSAAKADPATVTWGNYFPTTKKSKKEMMQKLVDMIGTVENPYLKQLLNAFFKDDKQLARAFVSHSAAKSIHHGYISGLMEHTIAVATLADAMADLYPAINRDLLITSALLHDIGKIQEISCFPENDYTFKGNLLGHIVIGAMEIEKKCEAIEGFPETLKDELIHCILAHHGELEYGSPKKPALIEAKALHFADLADAEIEVFIENLDKLEEGEDGTEYNRFAETRILKTIVE